MRFVHGGGSGALGAAGTGSIAWFNRSVTATNVKVYVHALECGQLFAYAYVGSTIVATAITREYCAPADRGEWYSSHDLILDASDTVGGISRVDFIIRDQEHDGETTVSCYRSRSVCG
ncbi:hypothetical protein Afil01_30840 [Actinorhabdospora filicis]|uniref:Uncharacterized protein n=1 Tax=Actinorhabdospora filicis TaxID=1785913 RepID=A0A9W6W3L1_9ACTN|nr:hypothetical protein Afil01_30840 [Actinorhabdospora filicis]